MHLRASFSVVKRSHHHGWGAVPLATALASRSFSRESSASRRLKRLCLASVSAAKRLCSSRYVWMRRARGGGFVWISCLWPIGTPRDAEHSCGMKPQEVELVLLEQSLANINRPFSERVDDVAEKTGGFVLFDIRVDGDARVSRIAAVGYGASGTVAILMDKYGQLSSTPTSEDCDSLVAELTAWSSLPMAEQVHIANRGAVAILLAKLRRTG